MKEGEKRTNRMAERQAAWGKHVMELMTCMRKFQINVLTLGLSDVALRYWCIDSTKTAESAQGTRASSRPCATKTGGKFLFTPSSLNFRSQFNGEALSNASGASSSFSYIINVSKPSVKRCSRILL